MRVRLKGVHRVKKTLADGTVRQYHYAWRGGPRLSGEPGTPEYLQSLADAHKGTVEAKIAGKLSAIIRAYQNTAEFRVLAAKTQKDYKAILAKIEGKFGTFPIQGLGDRRCRGIFLQWRDEIAETSPRQADYTFQVFARMLAWAYDLNKVPGHPLEKVRKVYRSDRSDVLWHREDQDRFLAAATPEMRLAFLLALGTAQRQADLLAMRWSQYPGDRIRVRQRKTGQFVFIPVIPELKRALNEARESREARPTKSAATTILVNSRGEPWTGDGFRATWRKACQKAGVADRTFHDIRGTTATRLLMLGFSVGQTAAITGHTLAQVTTLEKYVSRDELLASAQLVNMDGTEPVN